MRVRLTLENGGHTLSKVVEAEAVRELGALVQVDVGRERRVNGVRLDGDVYEVSLAEDSADLALYIDPAAHLAHIDRMKAAGWEVDDEQTLRGWLEDRISRRLRGGPAGQN